MRQKTTFQVEGFTLIEVAVTLAISSLVVFGGMRGTSMLKAFMYETSQLQIDEVNSLQDYGTVQLMVQQDLGVVRTISDAKVTTKDRTYVCTINGLLITRKIDTLLYYPCKRCTLISTPCEFSISGTLKESGAFFIHSKGC